MPIRRTFKFGFAFRHACFWSIAACGLGMLGQAGCGGSKPNLVPKDRPITQPDRPMTLPATVPTAAGIRTPTLADTQPSDFAGLHNVVAYTPNVFSGSVPEGKAGFESLKQLGIKTILTVDGAEPDLEAAQAVGIRYVHLPITYGGFDEKRKLELTKAVRDLPKPLYLHCHHGKHRSAGAAGTAAVGLGLMTPEEAVERMKVSGTAPGYKGLYACTANAAKLLPAVLDAVSGEFPTVVRPAGTVRTMLEIEKATDNLKSMQQAGWKPPANHPDLSPAAEAGRLADYYRFLHDDKESQEHPSAYRQWLKESNKQATALEDMLAVGTAKPAELDGKFKVVMQSCKDCHVKFRD